MELDQALRYLGNFGRFQILLYLVLNIIASIFTTLQLMGMVYVSYTPKPYYCTPPEGFSINETIPVFLDEGKKTYDSCNMYVLHDGEVTENITGCQFGWDFETFHGEQSVVTDFDLVCDDAILAKVAVSLFMTGILFSAVTSGQLADMYGRKPIMFISLVGEALSGLGMALAWNYYLFIFFWFLVGFFEQGLMGCGLVMIMEMFPPEKRTFAGSMCCFFRAAGDIIVSPIAYGLPNWRHYELLVSLICLLMLPAWWFIPESARWLISRGRVDEAEKILTKIADFNNIPVPTTSFLSSHPQVLELREEVVPLRATKYQPDKDAIYKPVPAPRKQIHASRQGHKAHNFSGHKSSTAIAPKFIVPPQPVSAQPKKKYSLLDIFKSRVLSINLFIMGFCWFVCGTVYFGLSLYSATLVGNVYFNVFLLCLVEIPAYIVAYFMMRWIARRITLSISISIAGALCVLTACVPDETSDGNDISALTVALATVGKFFISIAIAILFVFSPEIFPTCLRNVGFGACSGFTRVGGIIAPFVLHLNKFSEYIPLNIFGILSLLAGMLCLFLPETRNKPLPETIQDCERQGHPSCCPSKKRERVDSFNSMSD